MALRRAPHLFGQTVCKTGALDDPSPACQAGSTLTSGHPAGNHGTRSAAPLAATCCQLREGAHGRTPISGAAADTQRGKRKRVFAVNYDPECLDVVSEPLRFEGYSVTTTPFAPCTGDQIASVQPDLLLIDLRSQSRTGWKLLERLHAHSATTRIPVLVTSTDQHLPDRVRRECAHYGGNRLVSMPLDIDVLPRTVRGLTGEE